jgi:hypothetical protein
MKYLRELKQYSYPTAKRKLEEYNRSILLNEEKDVSSQQRAECIRKCEKGDSLCKDICYRAHYLKMIPVIKKERNKCETKACIQRADKYLKDFSDEILMLNILIKRRQTAAWRR